MEQITLSFQNTEELELKTSDMPSFPLHCLLVPSLSSTSYFPCFSPFLMNFSSLTTKYPYQGAFQLSVLSRVNKFRYAHHPDIKIPEFAPLYFLPEIHVYMYVCTQTSPHPTPFLLTGQGTENRALGAGPADPASALAQTQQLFSVGAKATPG